MANSHTPPGSGHRTPEPVAGASLRTRILALLDATRLFHPDEWPVRKLLRKALLLMLVVFVVALLRQGIGRVNEHQVGVMIHNLTGRIALKEREGYYIFLPYLTSFHVLDKTIQRLDLTWAQSPGSASRDLKLKTSDGSSVSLDISINFKLIPSEAVNVLRRSGTAKRFAEVWIEPFARHVCLASFGQLTTEEMYDAGRRNDRAQAALRQMNELLYPHGIEVIAMIPGEFRFYQEYEQVIQEKKLADQQVEEQQSQAKALLQDQARQLVEAQHRGLAQITTKRGESTNRLIQASAAADTTQRQADGYAAAKMLEADAKLFTASSEAQARRAILLTEAAGLEQRRQALRGEGGLNLVGLEYARRLEGVRLIGTPIAREPWVQQFAVQSPDAKGPEPPPPQHDLEASATLPLPGLAPSRFIPGIPGPPPR
jgi:regulator of protease activity HflC (stomatin/prohibitin superfamily)